MSTHDLYQRQTEAMEAQAEELARIAEAQERKADAAEAANSLTALQMIEQANARGHSMYLDVDSLADALSRHLVLILDDRRSDRQIWEAFPFTDEQRERMQHEARR